MERDGEWQRARASRLPTATRRRAQEKRWLGGRRAVIVTADAAPAPGADAAPVGTVMIANAHQQRIARPDAAGPVHSG